MSIILNGSDVFWANIPTFTCRNLEKLWNLLLINSGDCAQYWNRDFTNTNHFWALKWNARFNDSTHCPILNVLHKSVQKHFTWSVFIVWDGMYRIRRRPCVRHINTEANIQGDSGGMASIFGSDYNCYGEKEIYFNMCIILNGCWDRADRICM